MRGVMWVPLEDEVLETELLVVLVEAFRHDVLKRTNAVARFAERGVGCLGVVGHRTIADVVHELLPVQAHFGHDHVNEGLLCGGEPVDWQRHGDLAQGEGCVHLGGFVLETLGLLRGQDEGQDEIVNTGGADGLGVHGGVPC